MKYLKLTAVCLILLMCDASAQFRLPINNSVRNDVQKIVADYTHNFEDIRGQVLNKNPQSTEYESQLKPAGALSASITEYSSGSKSICAWQALMFSSEDFEAAAKKYKWLFSQLKGMNVSYVKDQYTLHGNFDEPQESLQFASSILTLTAPPSPLKKLKVEVSMQFEFPEWKVKLLVYEKEREDDERGDIND